VSPVRTAAGVAALVVVYVHDKGNRFRGVPGRLQRLDAHVAEIDDAAVANRRERVFGVGGAAEIDRGAGAVTQLEVAGNEIGVEVGQKDMGDAQAVIRSERQVLIDVALRIDDRGQGTPLIANKVRCVRQAVQIELSQDHRRACVLIARLRERLGHDSDVRLRCFPAVRVRLLCVVVRD